MHKDEKAVELCQQVVGMQYNDAIKMTDAAKITLRITRLDGVGRRYAQEWMGNRVNVVVENGKIISAQVG